MLQSANGTYNFAIDQVDRAGNRSTGAALQWVRDDSIPLTPVLSAPVGAVSYTNQGSITIAGSCTGSNAVTLGGDVAEADVASPAGVLVTTCTGGQFAYVVDKPDGTYVFTVFQTNLVPVDSGMVTVAVTKDTVAPASPTIANVAANPYASGSSITIAGGCEADATVRVWDTTLALDESHTCVNSMYSFTLDPGADGHYVLNLSQTDRAANTSSPVVQDWIRDSSMPATPSITSPAQSPYASASRSLNLTGGCQFGATVSITGVSAAEAGGSLDAACSATGTFAYAINLSMDKTVTIDVVQSNGVATSGAASLVWIADTTAPSLVWGAGNPQDGSTQYSSSASITFSSPDSSATFECHLDTGVFASCSSPVSLAGLANGSHTFYVRAKDAVGNTSAVYALQWVVSSYTTLALYHFDSAIGEMVDSAVLGVSGLTNSGTTSTTGKFAQGRSFGGSPQTISAAHHPVQNAGANAMTVELWAKFSSLPGTNGYTLAAKTGSGGSDLGWLFRIYKSGSKYMFRFVASTNGSTMTTVNGASSCAVTANTWHHLAVTWSSGTVTFFCNGTKITGGALGKNGGSVLFSSSQPLRLGYDPYTRTYLSGAVDEFRLSQGVRWTTSFALPVAPYSAD